MIKIPKTKWLIFRDLNPETGGEKKYDGKRYTYYWLVSVDYYREYGCLSDHHIRHTLPSEVQALLDEDMESHFEFKGRLGTLLPKVIDHGIVYAGDLT